MARPSDVCTWTASRRSAQYGSFWFVTTSVIVVFPVGPPGEALDCSRSWAASMVAIRGHDVSVSFRRHRTTRPSRSTIVPSALTTVNTPSFVGPIVRNAPPWPECGQEYSASRLSGSAK
jgi:hypothetical protein